MVVCRGVEMLRCLMLKQTKNSNQVEICETLCIVGNVKVFNQYKTNTDMYILKPIITEITKCIFFPSAIIDFLSANSIGF